MFESVETSRAWAEVDLDALSSNLLGLQRHVAGRGAHAASPPALMLVAKADAYGHGALAVARRAEECGVEALCVTTCDEALELREAGIRTRIVVLGPVFGSEALPALGRGIEFTIPSRELLEALERAARAVDAPVPVHLKVDSGLGRLGVLPGEALDALSTIRQSRRLRLAGLLTHLAATDGALSGAERVQVRRFRALVEEASRRRLISPRTWVHAANSAAVLSGLQPLWNAVRVGLAAYGVLPEPGLRSDGLELRPVLSLRARVVHRRELAPGDCVGYGSTWRAQRLSRMAVLPVGYDDGLGWRLSNRGHVLIRGRRAPIIGRVSMDYTTVDVTDLPPLALGEVATLVGRDGADEIRIDELADWAGTIPYEVMCSVGKRVRRKTIEGTATDPQRERRERETPVDPRPAAPVVPKSPKGPRVARRRVQGGQPERLC